MNLKNNKNTRRARARARKRETHTSECDETSFCATYPARARARAHIRWLGIKKLSWIWFNWIGRIRTQNELKFFSRTEISRSQNYLHLRPIRRHCIRYIQHVNDTWLLCSGCTMDKWQKMKKKNQPKQLKVSFAVMICIKAYISWCINNFLHNGIVILFCGIVFHKVADVYCIKEKCSIPRICVNSFECNRSRFRLWVSFALVHVRTMLLDYL